MARQQTIRASRSKALATGISAFAAAIACIPLAHAQDAAPGGVAAILDEIIVTARKREEASQDVPMAISALGASQLDALKIRDLTNLSVRLPNVALDDVGTARGTANFSIRGLGINSSIPGIDPTVGVVIDGVYVGLNNGLVFDTFDLQSVEVLRGPQGTLFGRNVTGGAVLLNTKKPADSFEFSARAAIDQGPDGGPSKYLMGSVGGPVSDGLAARLTVYYNDDDGFIENRFDGKDLGQFEQKMVRPVVVIRPNDKVELVLRYEYSKGDGDGVIGQSHTNGSGVPGYWANFNRHSFNVSIDEPGFITYETNAFTAQLDWDVAFGDGTVTNIFGWRDYESDGLADIDSQPRWLFHAPSWLRYEQKSNELRYHGRFHDQLEVTTGLYLFSSQIDYHERREMLGIATGGVRPAAIFDGGGLLDTDSWAVFASVDWDIDERWTLNAGVRYSEEDKSTKIASLSRNMNRPCNVVKSGNCPFDFVDKDSWNSVSPKLGFTYHLSDRAMFYGQWSQGTRSGGYNMRNTSFNPRDVPGPFDQETVDSIEFGYKATFERGRLNAAVFYNTIDDMQREINLPGPIGVIQLVRNTAEATIKGIEIDATFSLTDNLVALASVGITDAGYDKVLYDLNGDSVINGTDKALDLPRAAPVTYTLGLNHDLQLGGWGTMSSRVSYAYRDESAYTDNNLGILDEQKQIDAGIDFQSAGGHWVFSIYGRNLLNKVLHGNDTQLPTYISQTPLIPLGGTFAPLSKGRRIGIEVTYNL